MAATLVWITAEEWQCVRLTLLVGATSVAGACPVALAAAWLLSRARLPGHSLLDAAVNLPLVLPPVVTGWLLLLVFGIHGPVGAWLADWFGYRLVFTTAGASLACGVMVLPIMVRSIRLALELADPRLEAAARTLGATRLDRLFTVTLPLALPGILAGLIAAFAASLGEFGAVITFAASIPGQTQTLPLAIYSALQTPGADATAARLSLLSLGLAIIALMVANMLSRRVHAALRA